MYYQGKTKCIHNIEYIRQPYTDAIKYIRKNTYNLQSLAQGVQGVWKAVAKKSLNRYDKKEVEQLWQKRVLTAVTKRSWNICVKQMFEPLCEKGVLNSCGKK